MVAKTSRNSVVEPLSHQELLEIRRSSREIFRNKPHEGQIHTIRAPERRPSTTLADFGPKERKKLSKDFLTDSFAKRRSSKGILAKRQSSHRKKSTSPALKGTDEREMLNTSLMIDSDGTRHPRRISSVRTEYSSDFATEESDTTSKSSDSLKTIRSEIVVEAIESRHNSSKSAETIKTEVDKKSSRRSTSSSETAPTISTENSSSKKDTVLNVSGPSKSKSSQSNDQLENSEFSSVSSEFLPDNEDELAASKTTNDFAASFRSSRRFSEQKLPSNDRQNKNTDEGTGRLSPVSKYLADLRKNETNLHKKRTPHVSIRTESVSSYRPSDLSSSASPDRPVF